MSVFFVIWPSRENPAGAGGLERLCARLRACNAHGPVPAVRPIRLLDATGGGSMSTRASSEDTHVPSSGAGVLDAPSPSSSGRLRPKPPPLPPRRSSATVPAPPPSRPPPSLPSLAPPPMPNGLRVTRPPSSGLRIPRTASAPPPPRPGVPRARYLVTRGERPGQLVLTAITDPKTVAADALVVSLVAYGGVDPERLSCVLASGSGRSSEGP